MEQAENAMVADWWWGEAEYGVPLEEAYARSGRTLRRAREAYMETEMEGEGHDAV